MDYGGDGIDDETLTDSSVTPTHIYPNPGVYLARLSLKDVNNVAYYASVPIEVDDPVTLNLRMLRIWDELKSAIRQSDVDAAVKRVITVNQDAYRKMLSQLGTDAANIDSILPNILPVDITEDHAQFQMPRDEAGQTLSHFILFARDLDGVWRLKFF